MVDGVFWMERMVVKGYYMHEVRDIMRFWLEWMERSLCSLSWVKVISLATLISGYKKLSYKAWSCRHHIG